MKKIILFFCFISLAYAQPDEKKLIDETLTNWHKAASEADADLYFSVMDSDAIYLGTDAEERWTKDDFIVWASPYFHKGKGWNIYATKRNIFLSADKNFTWFDEELVSELGPARGSGVLIKTKEGWKLKQYNLYLTIPNDLI
ncbi:MAG: nuclear transport factor 2 family protein, partial [Ignavibacteriaceae bacterium]|nr:nuclear transport factor 2 family protein [Ignavibacteriaceae bacterium]